jgi:hypothetical protein
MSITFALIVTSCTYDSVYCVQQKTYYHTQQECGVAVSRLEDKLEIVKPKAKVNYFCLEQDVPTAPNSAASQRGVEASRQLEPSEVDSAVAAVAPPFASRSIAQAAWDFLHSQ